MNIINCNSQGNFPKVSCSAIAEDSMSSVALIKERNKLVRATKQFEQNVKVFHQMNGLGRILFDTAQNACQPRFEYNTHYYGEYLPVFDKKKNSDVWLIGCKKLSYELIDEKLIKITIQYSDDRVETRYVLTKTESFIRVGLLGERAFYFLNYRPEEWALLKLENTEMPSETVIQSVGYNHEGLGMITSKGDVYQAVCDEKCLSLVPYKKVVGHQQTRITSNDESYKDTTIYTPSGRGAIFILFREIDVENLSYLNYSEAKARLIARRVACILDAWWLLNTKLAESIAEYATSSFNFLGRVAL